MLAESTGRLASTIETANDFTIQILDLTLHVYPQTGSCVMNYRGRPGGIERGCPDPVFRIRLMVSSRVAAGIGSF